MAEAQKSRLRALITSYAREERDGQKMKGPAWSADFVKGKGQGLIFLLHGSPGVGKTCTAGSIVPSQNWSNMLTLLLECVAELLQRPLMILTSSDIGTDPVHVELNLTREFKKAKSWNAVLLIDEADVFMEQRSSRDLTRNSLVAGEIPVTTSINRSQDL
jgi:SpoVK/Ycf46/Vps4 family AAA+-type ATPase